MTVTTKFFEFPYPRELKKSVPQITGIAIYKHDWVITHKIGEAKAHAVKSYITGDKENDVDDLRRLMESKFPSTEPALYVIDKVCDVIYALYDNTKVARIIKRIQKQQKEEEEGEEEGEEKPVYAVRKYSGPEVNNGLAEAILINGEPFFAQTINGGTDIAFYEKIETANKILRPPTKQEYPPDSAYEFEGEDELRECINYAIENETLYSLYKSVHKFYTNAYFVDTDPHNSTFLALYTITSCFQDKFSTVPYIWLIGDNGSGKNSILITYTSLGYRVFYMAGASGPNLCEYLGTVEECQGTIAEDEVNDLDKDPHKRLLYMNGYASGSCVPKILDASSKSREQRFYKSYCQKMCASERLPSMKYSKGVMDRTFPIKCVKGYPKYNAKVLLKKRTTNPEVLRIINEVERVRKRLFAFRLVHFDDTINEMAERVSISARAFELTESAISLFYKYVETEEDKTTFDNEILPALSSFLKDRLGRRNDSLEARLYPIIRMLMAEEKKDEFDNDTIYDMVKSEMDGRDIPDKPGSMFYADDISMTVRRSDITKILREKFKADAIRVITRDGVSKRGHRFLSEALERIKASYEDEYEIRIIEDSSDRVYRPDRVLDQYVGQKIDIFDGGMAGGHEGIQSFERGNGQEKPPKN